MSSIIITGANQGIGYFMVLQLLKDGNMVAVLDLKISNIESLKNEYRGQLQAMICDMRDTVCVERCIAEIYKEFGTIDIAIHNACVCTFGCADETSEGIYKNVFDVNYFGALRLTKAVVPYMRKGRKGKIIFTSSGVGVMGFFNISPYASSKGAIEALAKCLNIEYQKDGINFHIFHPPLTKTKSSEPLPVPKEILAAPETVGIGLAKKINSKQFIICHSLGQKLQVMCCYLFPIMIGKFMSHKLL